MTTPERDHLDVLKNTLQCSVKCQNFIRRACHAYDLIILEELFGVPDEMSDIPEWAHSEINDLAEMLDKANEHRKEF